MSTYLLCSSPIIGHLSPLLVVARELVARGHHVDVLTGRKYAARVERAGARFLPLPDSVDYDDADLDPWLPERGTKKGLAALRYDLIGMFVRPLVEQSRAVRRLLAAERYDAVIGETAFLGLFPTLLAERRSARPPIVMLGVGPLPDISSDVPPFGSGLMPLRNPLNRPRNAVLNKLVIDGALGPVTAAANAALAEAGSPALPGSFADVSVWDRVFHLAIAELEFPRRSLSDHIRFVGPLRPSSAEIPAPAWWGDLDGRRVVHVTQGTIDNTDFTRLLVPAIRGLAGDDVLVVAATGGRPVAELLEHFPGGLPANARVAEMLPYGDLLPRSAVVVTNGGMGGVQQTLAAGVPLVVAGATEDKPDVAARVAWSGAGVNLRTGTPSAAKVAAGVRRVLGSPSFAARARELAEDFAAMPDPVDVIVGEIAAMSDASVRA